MSCKQFGIRPRRKSITQARQRRRYSGEVMGAVERRCYAGSTSTPSAMRYARSLIARMTSSEHFLFPSNSSKNTPLLHLVMNCVCGEPFLLTPGPSQSGCCCRRSRASNRFKVFCSYVMYSTSKVRVSAARLQITLITNNQIHPITAASGMRKFANESILSSLEFLVCGPSQPTVSQLEDLASV